MNNQINKSRENIDFIKSNLLCSFCNINKKKHEAN